MKFTVSNLIMIFQKSGYFFKTWKYHLDQFYINKKIDKSTKNINPTAFIFTGQIKNWLFNTFLAYKGNVILRWPYVSFLPQYSYFV